MLSGSDCGRLPDGVHAGASELADSVRGRSWPVNESARFILERTGSPLDQVIDELARAFRLPTEQARADVLSFVLILNGLLLMNVEHRSGRASRLVALGRLAVRLAPAGAVPAPLARRACLDTSSPLRAIVTALRATAPRTLLVAVVSALVVGQLVVVGGRGALDTAILVAVGAGAGLALHEAGHAVALTGVPAALVLRGRRTFILHAALGRRRRMVVAASGPLPVALLGGALVTAASVAPLPGLALVALGPAGHALGLTVAATDGRIACGL